MLITEWKKWMNRDILNAFNVKITNIAQQQYLQSLLKSMAELVQKMTLKIGKLQDITDCVWDYSDSEKQKMQPTSTELWRCGKMSLQISVEN